MMKFKGNLILFMTKKVFFLPLITFILISCGKQMEDSSDGNGRRVVPRKPTPTSLLRFIEKQKVECEDEFFCPESVAKLVVVDRETIRYCTGTLIDGKTMVTSSSCLTPSLRIPELDCSENIFILFPRTHIRPAMRAKCDKVTISDSNNSSTDPALWRSDFTFFKLQERVPRKPMRYSRRGMSEGSPYVAWKVDYETDTDGILRSETCYPVFHSYANPFGSKRSSPMIPVADCEYLEGNAGSPLINSKGSMVGLYSERLDKTVGTFILNSDILSEPMANIHHVANMSCVKTPKDLATYIYDSECNKDINVNQLDRLRSRIISSRSVHQSNMNFIKKELEEPIKYFKWDVHFVPNARRNAFEAHVKRPKCFYDIDKWVWEFTRLGRIRTFAFINVDYPRYRLYTKLNRQLKAVSVVDNSQTKSYRIEFNPKYAKQVGNTFVNVISDVFGRDNVLRFDNITDECN
jgi:hypothetical protein